MDGENTRKFLSGLTSHCLAQHISHCLFKETVIVNLVKQPNYVNTACLVDNTYNVLHKKAMLRLVKHSKYTFVENYGVRRTRFRGTRYNIKAALD